MAREVITRVWCDPCDERGEKTEAEEIVRPLGNKMVRIAVCEVDRKEIIEPYERLLRDLGVVEPDGRITPAPAGSSRGSGKTGRKNKVRETGPAIPPSPSDEPFFDIGTICYMPDCGEISKTQAGLTQHLRTHHKAIPMETYRDFLRGKLKPADVEQYRKDPVQEDFICRHDDPETGQPCGREFLSTELAKPRGAFSAHLRRTHDLSYDEAEAIHTSVP